MHCCANTHLVEGYVWGIDFRKIVHVRDLIESLEVATFNIGKEEESIKLGFMVYANLDSCDVGIYMGFNYGSLLQGK